MFCVREEEAEVYVEPVSKSHSEECSDCDKFSVAEEKLEEVHEGSAEVHHKTDASGSRAKPSATMPKFMFLPAPDGYMGLLRETGAAERERTRYLDLELEEPQCR